MRDRIPVIAAHFLLIGPPVGALAFWMIFEFFIGRYDSPPREWRDRLGDLEGLLLLSYPVGGIPALLAGIGTGALATRQGGVPLWQALSVVVAVIGTATILLAGIGPTFSGAPQDLPSMTWNGAWSVFALLALAALPAVLASWGVARMRGLL